MKQYFENHTETFLKKGESCKVRKIKPHEKINIRRKYLNMEPNLGATYQLYLNSVNNSPLTSFDEWLKQNYYFTNTQNVIFQVAQGCKQKEQFQVQQIIQFQGHQ